MDLPAADVTIDPELKGLCRTGGVAAWLLLAYSLATMAQIAVLGGPPATA